MQANLGVSIYRLPVYVWFTTQSNVILFPLYNNLLTFINIKIYVNVRIDILLVKSYCLYPDIDECKIGVSSCDQICVNNPGKHSCACMYGYTLSDDRTTCIKSMNALD